MSFVHEVQEVYLKITLSECITNTLSSNTISLNIPSSQLDIFIKVAKLNNLDFAILNSEEC